MHAGSVLHIHDLFLKYAPPAEPILRVKGPIPWQVTKAGVSGSIVYYLWW